MRALVSAPMPLEDYAKKTDILQHAGTRVRRRRNPLAVRAVLYSAPPCQAGRSPLRPAAGGGTGPSNPGRFLRVRTLDPVEKRMAVALWRTSARIRRLGRRYSLRATRRRQHDAVGSRHLRTAWGQKPAVGPTGTRRLQVPPARGRSCVATLRSSAPSAARMIGC